MVKFRIVPLRKEVADRIRRQGCDDFGNAIVEKIAVGPGPCRVSLKPFIIGVDKRLLLKHNPFAIDNAYSQSGPIFIYSADVNEYADVHRFPLEIKADKQNFPLTLIGYDQHQSMVLSQLVGDADVDELIGDIFARKPAVDFLHVRNSEACCYMCGVERAD